MDTMPGVCFHIAAGLLMFPFFVLAWIDLYTIMPDVGRSKSAKSNLNQINNNNPSKYTPRREEDVEKRESSFQPSINGKNLSPNKRQAPTTEL
jgi:UPF0716 family protein affecting phage T7 exclusion